MDWAEAVATRRLVLAEDRVLVAGMHLDFPGFCHVVPAGEGDALVAEPWSPAVWMGISGP